MSVGSDDEAVQVAARLAAGRAAHGRSDARLTGAIADLALADDVRLDERTRLSLIATLTAILTGIATDIRRHAARILATGGDSAKAEAVLTATPEIFPKLATAGLMRERALIDELIARVRSDLVAGALPTIVGGPDQASLLIRLADVDDGVVAAAAKALLAAEVRRRTAEDAGTAAMGDLPAELHHHLVWWTAAAIRDGVAADPATDRALIAAAQRSLAAHDEGDRVEAAAMRLAQAIDARPDELGPLLTEALGDRRLALFVAVLARAVGIDYEAARGLVLDPEGDHLWLALRAAALDRVTIARIALSLSEADPRRDIEAFADEIDTIAAIPPDAARPALAPMTLNADFRAAIDALARGYRV